MLASQRDGKQALDIGRLNMKVLIVDDDRFVRQGLKKLIPWKDMQCLVVGEAADGASGWKLVLEQQPDLVITDVRMPGIDGIELARRIHKSMSGIQVIMLSAYADFEYAQSAIRYNVRNYLLKPLNQEKLRQLAEQIAQIAEEYNKTRQYFSMRFLERTDRPQIWKALQASDIQAVSDFFETAIPELELHGNDLRTYCMELISLLFDYLQSLGLGQQAANHSKRDAVLQLSELKSDESILSLSYQLYLDTLQFSLQKVSGPELLSESIHQYVLDHFTDPEISVASVAQVFYLSPVYTGTLFRKSVGVNFSQFLAQLRMERAAALLRDPSFRVQDVSQAVGYTDAQYFGRVFKKVYGVAPSEYRKIRLAPAEEA